MDYDRLAALIDFQARNGTHGVLINGTTSEPSTLTVQERNQAVSVAMDAAQGRLQVVAATGSQSHAESVALTEHAAKAGVDALLLVTPYYVRPPQRGVAAYFIDIGRRVDIPLMMYHIPGRTAFKADLRTLEEIADALPHFGRHQACRGRPLLRHGNAAPLRAGIPGIRRAGGIHLPDDVPGCGRH